MMAEWTDWHTQHEDKIELVAGIDCWIWIGAHGGKGYGRVKYDGKPEFAHRASFCEANGRHANGLVRHSCHNRMCVRPSHLSEGTPADNGRDMALAFQGCGKLVERDVRKIRQLYDEGLPLNQIAERFGIAGGSVYPIVTYKSYRHVDPHLAGKHKRRTFPKVTSAIVQNVRDRLSNGQSNADIARELNIAKSAVSNIKTGRRYAGI